MATHVLRSGRYPLEAVSTARILAIRRCPELPLSGTDRTPLATCLGFASLFRMWRVSPPASVEVTSTVLVLARPEYLNECRFRRFPGSVEKIGPATVRLTMNELFFRSKSHWS